MTTSTSIQISRRTGVLFLVFAVILLVANILVVKQNWDLKNFIKERFLRPPDLPIGTRLPPLSGTDTDGKVITINYGQDKRKTILLSFAPSCEGCDANMPQWKALLNGINKDLFRTVAVAVIPEGVEEYASKHNLISIPLIANLTPENRATYNLRITPQTILIDSDGRVEKIWTGFLQGEKQAEVEQLLNVKLPFTFK